MSMVLCMMSEDAAFEIDCCKACGPDDIPGRLLKEEAPWLAEPLIQLYNLSLQSGVLPRDWRRANVTLVFKKGDKHSPSNYRPISLTSLVVKCLERLVHTRIVEFLEANNKLSSHQHGFRKGHSCQTQLLGMIYEWARSLDNRLSTHVIYLELDCMGIRGNILRWIKVFLSDREQRVLVDGQSSDWEVTSGVLQGSILRLLLFSCMSTTLMWS